MNVNWAAPDSPGPDPGSGMPGLVRSIIAVIVLLGTAAPVAAAPSCPGDTITRQALGEAMREALGAPGGSYSLLATANSVRFQSAVFQRLIEHALARRPAGGTLFIPHDALWWEFLGVAGLGTGEEDKAPIGRRLAFEYHQGIEVTFGPWAAVVKRIRQGPTPLIAANVRLAWPDRPDGLRTFSFVDTLSIPRIKSTNHQVMSFRFLVFNNMVVLDEIEGISGRPLSGLLGTLFKLIGEGDILYARFNIAADGRQVLRTKARKVISKTVTATINPDGKAQNGLPDGRLDLIELESTLKLPFEFDYFPYHCVPPPE